MTSEPEDGAEPAGPVTRPTDELRGPRERRTRQQQLDLATGLLMARLGLAPAEALEQLAAVAEATGQRPEEVAADLLHGSDSPPVGAAAAREPALPQAAEEADAGDGPDAREGSEAAADAVAGEDLDELAEALLRDGLAPLGACGVLVWRQVASDCLELVGGAGHSRLERAHWQLVSPLWDGPLRRAFATGTALWLADGPAAGQRLPGPDRHAARAVLPLHGEQGLPVGVAAVCWPGPTRLDGEVRGQLASLVEVAAHVLAARERRAEFRTSAQLPRPVLTSLLDLLAHPAILLHRPAAGAGPVVEHANRTARRICSGCAPSALEQALPYAHVPLSELLERALENQTPQTAPQVPAEHHPGEPGTLVNVRVLPVGPEHAAVLWHSGTLEHSFSVLRVAGGLGGLGAFEDDLTTGTSRWSEHAFTFFGLPEDADPVPLSGLARLVDPADADELTTAITRLIRRQDEVKLVVRARRAQGGVRRVQIVAEPLLTHGTLTGITGIFQDVTGQYHTEAALAATFDRLTDVQEQADTRHRLALQMQQAIVPEMPEPQRLPGLEVAARYRPAAQEYRVGGDWYDVLPLPGDRVMVAVGDLAGHGIEAATGMVALRNALRGLAVTGESPARLLHWLNELTLRTGGHLTATALCAIFEPGTRRLTWSSAGHLPPLLLREGRARLLESDRNVLLGAAADVAYRETSTTLRAQDTLVLYTDGLVERRGADLRQSLALLGRAAQDLAGNELGDLADRLLAQATGDTEDDTSLIALRIR
ncbi:SpoIIE family protein phosphatase [Kitasatospora sp. NBC_01302]|uniref:SpoIIE family protein phosphatase n=1 Tax=Kitasatospora sp. NBC_01302 TaxID=2903575 RepID=UPI002E0F37F2|nr:SpoIIE family protein phosphatase [Kitasatospora sp. NBC_01302]